MIQELILQPRKPLPSVPPDLLEQLSAIRRSSRWFPEFRERIMHGTEPEAGDEQIILADPFAGDECLLPEADASDRKAGDANENMLNAIACQGQAEKPHTILIVIPIIIVIREESDN